MASASLPMGSRNNVVFGCVVVCLAVCLVPAAVGSRGPPPRAAAPRGLRSVPDEGALASTPHTPVSEMFSNFGRNAGVSSLSSSKALEDLHRALQAAPKRLTVSLPFSGSFAAAFMEYKDTGVCKAWTDATTGMISTGLDDAQLYSTLEDRPREVKTDLDEIRKAAEDGDVKGVISLVYRGMPHTFFFVSLGVGCVLLLLWFFCFCWQACSRSCRKVCCCCMRIKRRAVSGSYLCLAAVLGIGLCAAAMAFVGLSAAGMHNALNSIGSSACAAMEMIQVGEWGTPTSDGKIETTFLLPGLMRDNVGSSNFMGVRGMVENLNGMAALFSEDFHDNILKLVKRPFLGAPDIGAQVMAVERGGTALRRNIKVLEEEAGKRKMKSLLASVLARNNFKYEKPVVDAYIKYKEGVAKAFDEVSLGKFVFDEAVDISDMEEGVSQLHQFGVDVARIATPFASVMPKVLEVETGLLLLGVILGLIALAFFLLSKGKSSICFSALAWNYLMLVMSVCLIITAVLFFASSTATQLCDAGVKAIWELRPSADETNGKDPGDGASTDSPDLLQAGIVLAECMHNPNFNFLEAQGLSKDIENVKETMRHAKKTVMGHLHAADSLDSTAAAKMLQDWVNDLDGMVVFDFELLQKDSETKDLVYTFREMLQSGVQEKTKTVKLGDNQTETIYGMDKVKELIAPAGIDGYSKATDGNIQVTSMYPTANNPDFIAWLNVQRKNRKKYLMEKQSKKDRAAEQDAKEYAEKLKNAVLLTVLKLRLLNGEMPCYRSTPKGVIQSSCTGKELFEQSTPEWNVVSKSAWDLAFAASVLGEATRTQYTEGRNYVQDVFFLLEHFIDNITASYNCSFVRQNMLEAVYLACNRGADDARGATVVRFLGLIFGVILAFFVYFFWRILRDNKDCRSTVAPANEAPADQENNEAEGKNDKSPTDGGRETASLAPPPV
ncbi:hypothetical protein ACSSS7_003512 [Eimeria intestinalis]